MTSFGTSSGFSDQLLGGIQVAFNPLVFFHCASSVLPEDIRSVYNRAINKNSPRRSGDGHFVRTHHSFLVSAGLTVIPNRFSLAEHIGEPTPGVPTTMPPMARMIIWCPQACRPLPRRPSTKAALMDFLLLPYITLTKRSEKLSSGFALQATP